MDTASGKFWFLATLARRKVARGLAQAGGATGSVDPGAGLPRFAAMRDLLAKIDALAAQASRISGSAGLTTDGHILEQASTEPSVCEPLLRLRRRA